MNTATSVSLGVVLIILVGGIVFWQKSFTPTYTPVQQTNYATTTDASATTTSESMRPRGLTSAEVALHASRDSCWATINGNVYDLTSWIPQHPGGEQAILQLCGTDGTEKFNRQHGKSSKVVVVLSGFKIGIAQQ